MTLSDAHQPVAQNNQRGIFLMMCVSLVFAVQDALSRHLAGSYNVWMVVMIRYWFFALFVLAIASRRPGGVLAVARTRQPVLQIFRGLLLSAEICVMVQGFVYLGLVESHAVFACYPLLIAALSGPVLGEKVGWRRWMAISIGFIGILVVLQPGLKMFEPAAILPLMAALMFALYGLLTRYAARRDSAETSFFWTGIAGTVSMTAVGVWFLEPMSQIDWVWMLLLCAGGALGHWLLIKCYEVAEAGAVQPFAYMQLIFAAAAGILIFHETLHWNVVTGAGIVVGTGLFTLWRERISAGRSQPQG